MTRKSNPALVILILLLGDILLTYLSFSMAASLRTFLIPWMGGRGLWKDFNSVAALGMIYLISIFVLTIEPELIYQLID